MAATLPAINQGRGGLNGGMQQMKLSAVPKHPTSALILTTGVKKRSQGKKEREMEQRKATLRSQQPFLDKVATSQYRNTYKHNMFLDMLQEGYHKSFIELFALIKQQNETRLAAGPESSLWTKVLLENEPEKLETLKLHLTQAETAARKKDNVTVYKCQYQLARYFQSSGDKWLADHFFAACLNTAANVKGDEGKTSAEGHCNVGLAMEETGENFAAAENFEKFHELTMEKQEWCFDDGMVMHSQACIHLSRIYTTIAQQRESMGDLQQYRDYLQKAYDMARQAGDRKILGEASYRLGLAFEKNGDSKTALTYLNGYLDICQASGDNSGYGMACEAIAKSYESQGQVEEAIKYLEMYVERAERSKDDKAISRACSDLGAIFNSLGRYEAAVEYFNKSYNIARAMNDTETISSSRVLFGVAAAHKMLESMSHHLEIASTSKSAIIRLIDWKDNRADDFEQPIPQTPVPSVPATPRSGKTRPSNTPVAQEHASISEEAEEDS